MVDGEEEEGGVGGWRGRGGEVHPELKGGLYRLSGIS